MTIRPIPRGTFERLLLAACIGVYCVILTAGLWPFNPYQMNQVSWAQPGPGLLFGDYGVVLSPRPFELKGSGIGGCALALWLEPSETYDSNVILDFYTPENPFRFRLRQDLDDLSLARDVPSGEHSFRTQRMYFDHTFRRGATVLIGVSVNPPATSVYLNGVLARTSTAFGLTCQDLRGQIIIGNSPIHFETWGGLLRGLAIYDRALSTPEMLGMYATWMPGDPDGRMKNSKPVALYLFNEGAGSWIHDQMASGTDLQIPAHFQTVGQEFLTPFWREYSPDWAYWKDVGINIGGFVPLGFCFCAYFSLLRRVQRPALATVLLGAATSLMIEFCQAFLPTRSSGTTDLITNTLGTAIGVWLSRQPMVWRTIKRVLPYAGSFQEELNLN